MNNWSEFSNFTLVDLLQFRASQESGTADSVAFKYLNEGEGVSGSITFSELDRRAQAIAVYLAGKARPGDRALLVYPPSLDYIAAFWGCLYAGVIAVPALPPANARTLPRLKLIADDAQATLTLSLTAIADKVASHQAAGDSSLRFPDFVCTDLVEDTGEAWVRPKVTSTDVAFLQYTSGSTGTPKGVMVTHGNILANVELIRQNFPVQAGDNIVSWLPPHHDMGLIGKILFPTYVGATCVQFPPAAFLKRPYRWLKAISDHRARITAAPNFAYELCTRKITESQKESLDLSSLEFALNGSEPIRPSTLIRFEQAFAPCGLKSNVLVPVYGMAETTLLTTAKVHHSAHDAAAVSLEISKSAIAQGEICHPCGKGDATEVVSTGPIDLAGREIIVVDQQAMKMLGPDRVGEIWVRTSSVAAGYWNRAAETERTFAATVPESDLRYLRTGDLGFHHAGELYIVGRLKELMIFNGRNLYPQDIESTVESLDPAFRANGCAAFSVETEDSTELVIVQELETRAQPRLDTLIPTLRAELGELHGISEIHSVVLIKSGGLPRTSSGKIQRVLCRDLFLQRRLSPKWEWSRHASSGARESQVDATPSFADAESRLLTIWKDILDVSDIPVDANFFDLGGSSQALMQLHGRVVKEFESDIAVSDLFRYPTVREAAKFLSSGVSSVAHTQAPPEIASRLQSEALHEPNAIAIIGMSARFPQARNVSEYWRNLTTGAECISFGGSPDPANEREGDPASRPGFVRAVSSISDIALFDASFFGFLPREAEITDPQHRILLECGWEAIESAGYDPLRHDGAIGVYAGASFSSYLLRNLATNPDLLNEVGDLAWLIGNDKDFLATRLSYKLHLTGPAVAVQTACSTSLTAVHLACRSLLNHECDMALAGAVSVREWDTEGYQYTPGGILSSDGHCRPFDAKASGTVFGSGAGVVVLKRLDQALADNDTIHAVILGSAINNDGSAKVGYTAPSVNGQAKVISDAMRMAGVSPNSISYVETHGTATPLGDPIEIAALTQAFGQAEVTARHCAIGSVKANIGHLDTAAGMAGLIKTILSLKHRAIPPSINYEAANPQINFHKTPFFVNTELLPWNTDCVPRRAGVSSFGFGGTNVHMILEEAPAPLVQNESGSEHLIVLSARSNQELDAISSNLAEFLRDDPTTSLADAAYTSQVGRRVFKHKRFVVGANRDEMVQRLLRSESGQTTSHEGGKPAWRVAFMFPGQGSQHVDMGRELYATQPVFRNAFDQCVSIIKRIAQVDLRDILFSNDASSEVAAALINHTSVAQPALFSIEYAIAQQLLACGIAPSAMVGHSIGEYVAACLAGVLTLEDALRIVVQRGRLMGSLESGAMLSVNAPEEVVLAMLPDGVAVAAVNSPALCVVSGTHEAIATISEDFRESKIGFHRLATSHAFHSELMTPILEEFGKAFVGVALQPPNIPYVSNVTGDWITAEEATDPGYWVVHLRNTVRFSDCVSRLVSSDISTLLEVGPGQALSTLVRQQRQSEVPLSVLPVMPRVNSHDSELRTWLSALGNLWAQGNDVNWLALYGDERRRRVPLPTYPFNKKRYWVEPLANAGVKIPGPFPAQSKHDHQPFERDIDQDRDSGKADEKSTLPESAGTPTEEILRTIWKNLFGLEAIRTDDDFFELGGHSLLAVQLASKIRDAFGCEVSLQALFDSPTINGLASVLDAQIAEISTAPATIQRSASSEGEPLSFSQQRLWFIDQFEPGSAIYNIPVTLRLTGQPNVEALRDSLNEIVRRHESLRTTFVTVDGEPMQVVAPTLNLQLSISDLTELSDDSRKSVEKSLVNEEMRKPFDLASGPLIRAHLIHLTSSSHVFLLTVHHIVSDGWSMGIIVRELSVLYTEFALGRSPTLSTLPIQYADFARWQRRTLTDERLAPQLAYWKSRLTDAPPVLSLPTDMPRAACAVHPGAIYSFEIPAETTRSLEALGKEKKATLFMVLGAVFNVLLARYSGQTDICIGTPVANRGLSEVEPLIGFFVNTLVFRTTVDFGVSFNDLLQQVRRSALDAYSHQDVPFERVVDLMKPERLVGHSPLFQVMLILQNAPLDELALPGLTVELAELDSVAAKFDLTLSVTEGADKLRCSFEYAADLFGVGTISRMANHFVSLCESAVQNPAGRLDEMRMLGHVERHQLLEGFNDTRRDYPNSVLLHELFEQQVRLRPDAPAACFEAGQLSYDALNRRANQLARHLRELGVGPDTLVAICAERSLEMVVALLAVLKAGGAYVPLDPAYPPERLHYMLQDAQPRVLLTQHALRERLPDTDAPVFTLDLDWHHIAHLPAANLPAHDIGLTSRHLAYVIYTSGSTGQ
ncbi:type I polyketide synthase, partial [Burkholderia ubonensis]|uniref:type I polyketide synthase n=1 Tax=Burkholderia ubonensis TaxID=101571 RepID=UPI0012F9CCAC